MPFYEYRCNACGHELEVMQKISDSPLKTCPECHKDSLKKLISRSSFLLKGEGWYKTDYKKPKAQQANTSDEKPAKTTAEKTTDTKPETKTSNKETA